MQTSKDEEQQEVTKPREEVLTKDGKQRVHTKPSEEVLTAVCEVSDDTDVRFPWEKSIMRCSGRCDPPLRYQGGMEKRLSKLDAVS